MKTINMVGALVIALTAGQARAELITFDDLPSDEINPIQNGYAGLNWDNVYVLNGNIDYPGTGYQNGIISGNNVAYNGFGNAAAVSDNSFTLNSAYFTSAWNDDNILTVDGYLNGQLQYAVMETLNTQTPLFVTFPDLQVDDVVFSTSDDQFAMDNMTINAPVPEPTTVVAGAMLLLPFGMSTLRMFRKNRTA